MARTASLPGRRAGGVAPGLMPPSVRHALARVAGLDARSLACLRAGLGAVLIWDMTVTQVVAADWWQMQGYDQVPLPAWLTIGSPELTLRLAAAAMTAVGVGLLLGWRTPWMTWAAWLGACAHHYAGRGTADYHNALLCTLLLWSLALPLGERWSLDAAAGRRTVPPPCLRRAGGLGLVASLAWVYLSTALAKTGAAWWDGSAVWLALMDRATQAGLGRAAAGALPVPVLQAATWTVLAIEWLAPLGILWPRLRGPAALALAGTHAAMWALMDLGAFPLTALAVAAALVPATAWDRVRASVAAAPRARTATPAATTTTRWLAGATAALQAAAVAITLEGHRIATAEGDWPYAGARQVLRLKYLLGTEVRWAMYAPQPFTDTGWWVAVARRKDGDLIDPVTGRLPTPQPPAPGDGTRLLRWLYLSQAPSTVEGEPLHDAYSDFLLGRSGPAPPCLALLWMFEPLQPYRSPAAAVPLLALTEPGGCTDPEALTGVLGRPVHRVGYDDDGNLAGPQPLSHSEERVF